MNLGGVLVMSVSAVVCVELTIECLSLPVVSIDAVSGQCIRVDSIRGELPCSALPAHYIQQIVHRPAVAIYRDPPSSDIGEVLP